MFNHIIKIYELESIEKYIDKLNSRVIDNELILDIKLKIISSSCKYCMSNLITIKDYSPKKIVHSISLTRSCYINYKQRRYFCKNCGRTFIENNPFSSTNDIISTLTIMNILEYLKDYNHTFSSASKMFNVSIQSVINIFDKHVSPKPKKLPRVLSIDEIHIKSNIKYPYACVLLDFEKNIIVDVIKSRHKSVLISYFERKTIKELDTVEYITMDLWSPYKDIAKKYMPKAKIVADSFHVVSLINKILDKKRIQVMNNYLRLSNKDLNYSNDYGYLLKKFSWMIRISPEKIKRKLTYINKYKMYIYSDKLLQHILKSDEELFEIYKLRNSCLSFNSTSNYDQAIVGLELMITKFINHNIEEIRDYGKTLKRWKNEIINSFSKDDNVRYSNGKLEGKNRDLKTIIRNSYGYKNFERFRARSLYSINKDTEIKL